MARRILFLSLSLVLALVASGASATSTPRNKQKTLAYLPKGARMCELGAHPGVTAKYCKRCNEQAIVGASDSVVVQVGGCRGSGLATIAEFTPTDVTIDGNLHITGSLNYSGGGGGNGCSCPNGLQASTITPVTGTGVTLGDGTTTTTVPGAFKTNSIAPATGTSVTIDGDLIITGESTHYKLETFYGDIATDTIYSTAPATKSVNVPGKADNSLQIGLGANALSTYATVYGQNANATEFGALALGPETSASGPVSTAIGGGSVALSESATALGSLSNASAFGSCAIGGYAWASGDSSVAVGFQCTCVFALEERKILTGLHDVSLALLNSLKPPLRPPPNPSDRGSGRRHRAGCGPR